MAVLSNFRCRLHRIITHDPPSYTPGSDRPFWRCGMSRAMLHTLTRSLLHGELSLGKGVSVAEAMTTFEFENIAIGVPSECKGHVALLRPPPTGVAFQKTHESIQTLVLRTCEQIADAIARWPRLEVCMNAALSGLPTSCTCTATRAWVRFCRKPVATFDKGDHILQLARKWPAWMLAIMYGFGILHTRLAASKSVDPKGRDAEAYKALQTAVESAPLGSFFSTVHDTPRHAMDTVTRKEYVRGHNFGSDIRNVATEAAYTKDQGLSGPLPAPLVYARSCISLADMLVHNAPSPATMFSGQCSDDNGRTPERQQLAKSLQQRGIKIIRWSEDEKPPSRPLLFPPAWADGSPTGSTTCSMLLDFTERRER